MFDRSNLHTIHSMHTTYSKIIVEHVMYAWITWVVIKSTAPLEIYLLRKMVTCSIIILPAVVRAAC